MQKKYSKPVLCRSSSPRNVFQASDGFSCVLLQHLYTLIWSFCFGNINYNFNSFPFATCETKNRHFGYGKSQQDTGQSSPCPMQNEHRNRFVSKSPAKFTCVLSDRFLPISTNQQLLSNLSHETCYTPRTQDALYLAPSIQFYMQHRTSYLFSPYTSHMNLFGPYTFHKKSTKSGMCKDKTATRARYTRKKVLKALALPVLRCSCISFLPYINASLKHITETLPYCVFQKSNAKYQLH